MSVIISTNPALREDNIIGTLTETTPREVEMIVTDARTAWHSWRHTPVSERVRLLREVYRAIEDKKEILAQSVATEMGMPIRFARDDVGYGLTYFDWYLTYAESILADEVTYETDTEIHTVSYESKGVIAAITPWNYPVMLWAWACLQPLLAGNTVVWKISREVALTGKLIDDIITRCHLPMGVWNIIHGSGALGDILTDADIDGITFTGSTAVGEGLRKKALEKNITTVMELGGSAPGIICEDADIDSILDTLIFLRFSNSGQMCDGLKRLIVHSSRYEEVVEKLTLKIQEQKIGNPLEEDITIGPLVNEKQVQYAQRQLDDALAKGAIVLTKNSPDLALSPSYFPLIMLGGITTDMLVWREEVFAPILPIITYETESEAIALANDTVYGLGAYVFTESVEGFERIARELESGMVQMNNVNYCIPADPFGGYKSSGVGREHGKWGFHELTNIKVTSRPKVKG